MLKEIGATWSNKNEDTVKRIKYLLRDYFEVLSADEEAFAGNIEKIFLYSVSARYFDSKSAIKNTINNVEFLLYPVLSENSKNKKIILNIIFKSNELGSWQEIPPYKFQVWEAHLRMFLRDQLKLIPA